MAVAYELSDVEAGRGDFTLRIAACRLAAGGVYAAVGPNGSGKSTFLDLLALLLPPRRGCVRVDGEDVAGRDPDALLPHRRRIGYLLQKPYLFNMSAAENVGYGLRLRGVLPTATRARVQEAMEQLDIAHLAHRNAHTLSGGEAQRVALARTFVLEPAVLLLDEPTANVDRRHVATVEEFVRDANTRRGTTVVLATHSRDQAYRLARHVLSIIDGAIRDVAYENVFTGALTAEPDGLHAVRLREGPVLHVTEGRPGSVTVAVDPQDVLLSAQELASSALNRFHGTISRIEDVNGTLRVFVDVGADFCAVISKRSFLDMRLNIGTPVWVTFKASAVKVL
jgi:tungstate transport system ATP-binding protein